MMRCSAEAAMHDSHAHGAAAAAGCLFIATNADSRGHFTADQEWPGAGATVGAIKGDNNDQPYGVKH